MSNSLKLEFIHRCIYNACPKNELRPMYLSIAHVSMCVCSFYTHVQNLLVVCVCCECVCGFFPCAVCQRDRTSADGWGSVCFNEPPQRIHLGMVGLVSHFTPLLLVKISEAHTPSCYTYRGYVCVCVLTSVYLCVLYFYIIVSALVVCRPNLLCTHVWV